MRKSSKRYKRFCIPEDFYGNSTYNGVIFNLDLRDVFIDELNCRAILIDPDTFTSEQNKREFEASTIINGFLSRYQNGKIFDMSLFIPYWGDEFLNDSDKVKK